MKTKIKKSGEPSWRIATRDAEAFVTETGGQVGPVTFQIGGKKIQPFSVAPWAEEPTRGKLPPLLRALRGDFFCLPFGGNATPFKGEQHPVHGETANQRWRLQSVDTASLHLSLNTKIRRGRVDKFVFLREGHSAVYQRHVITGMSGRMNFGHHAMLKFPDVPGCGIISTSRFVQGQTFPAPFEHPEQRGYSALKPGATFRSLDKVESLTGEPADLSRYPARRGFDDLVMIVSDIAQPFAWTAVTFPTEGYVWFALKDPRTLRQTVFWISNGGRHYAPWNGRHVNVMGLEEVSAYFHFGLAESVGRNLLARSGVPTCLRLDPRKPLVVNHVMAMAAIPKGFDRVAAITPAAGGQSVNLSSPSQKNVTAKLDLDFIGLEKLLPNPVT